MKRPAESDRWLPLLAALVACVVGLPSLAGGWVWDDHWAIEQSPLLGQPRLLGRLLVEPHGYATMIPEGTPGGYYRPLATLLHGVMLLTLGPHPLAFRILSVLLHAGCCYTLAAWLRRLQPSAAWSSLFLAVSPQAAEAFGWVSATPDLLAALGLLLALWCFVAGRPWLGGGALLIALLGKESAAAGILWLPLLARGGWLGDRRRWLLPTGIAIALYAALRLITVGFVRGPLELPPGVSGGGFSLVGRVFLVDLARVVWPWNVTLDAPPWAVDSGHAALGSLGIVLLALLLVAGLALHLRRPTGAIALLPLLPIAALLPVLQIVRTNDPYGGRFLYLASAGFAAAMGLALLPAWKRTTPGRRGGVAIVAALILAALGVRAALRGREWRDDVTLFESERRRNPESLRGEVQLADALLNRGQLREAEPHVLHLMTVAPRHPRVRAQQALLWMNQGRAAEAEEIFRELVATWHRTPTMLANLAGCELRQGRYADGLATLDEANRLSTPTVGMLNNRGLALQGLGRHDEARREFEAALARDPHYRPARVNLVLLLAGPLDDAEAARREARRYLELFPNGPEVGRMEELLKAGS